MLAPCKNVRILGHQYPWLAGGYVLEIRHFYKWLAWWLPGGQCMGFSPSDTTDEAIWMTTEENGFIIKQQDDSAAALDDGAALFRECTAPLSLGKGLEKVAQTKLASSRSCQLTAAGWTSTSAVEKLRQTKPKSISVPGM